MLKITPALIDAFIKNLTEQEYSPATISKYAHDARALMEYAPDGITDKAQLVGFRSWLEQRGYSGASVNSMLGAVNALLVYIGTDWRLKYVRVQRRTYLPADRELNQTEYERMVRAAEQQGDRRLSLLVQTLCALGLRVSELKAITVESLASGEASIRNKGKLHTILIPDALAKKLRAYCKERAITTGPVFVTRTGKTLTAPTSGRCSSALLTRRRCWQTPSRAGTRPSPPSPVLQPTPRPTAAQSTSTRSSS